MICCKLWHFSDHLYWYIRQHKGPGSQAQELQQKHVSAYKENYWNNLVIYMVKTYVLKVFQKTWF